MSGVHLFAAGALAEGRYHPGGYVAVCGAVAPPCSAFGEGDDDPTYCKACVRAAAGWNAAGVERPRSTCTARAQTWACDRCDSMWAVSVVNPRPFLDRLATAVSLRSLAAELLALAEQQAQRDADTDP